MNYSNQANTDGEGCVVRIVSPAMDFTTALGLVDRCLREAGYVCTALLHCSKNGEDVDEGHLVQVYLAKRSLGRP